MISPGKGIEVAIAAMPAIVARHPTALYAIAGQTHPDVAKLHGEEYRISLERLARDLVLADHVIFDDRFLSMEDLSAMLAETTICLMVIGLLDNPEELERRRTEARTGLGRTTGAEACHRMLAGSLGFLRYAGTPRSGACATSCHMTAAGWTNRMRAAVASHDRFCCARARARRARRGRRRGG